MVDNARIEALGFSTAKHIEFVRLWAFADEIGHYELLNVVLGKHEPKVAEANDHVLTAAQTHFRNIAHAALGYEAEHGKHSLRKLDHPWWADVLPGLGRHREMVAAGMTGWVYGKPDWVTEQAR